MSAGLMGAASMRTRIDVGVIAGRSTVVSLWCGVPVRQIADRRVQPGIYPH
jgi:hypothetical protein